MTGRTTIPRTSSPAFRRCRLIRQPQRRPGGSAQHRLASDHERLRRLPRRRRPAAARRAARSTWQRLVGASGRGLRLRRRTSMSRPTTGSQAARRVPAGHRRLRQLPAGEPDRHARDRDVPARRARGGRAASTAGLPACEDYDLYLRMARRSRRCTDPSRVAEYWHHGGNMSRDSALMLRSALPVLGRHEDEARSPRRLSPTYRAGVVGWKRHYAAVWWSDAAATAVAADVRPHAPPPGPVAGSAGARATMVRRAVVAAASAESPQPRLRQRRALRRDRPPRVSAIIIVHNGEAFLDEAIESVMTADRSRTGSCWSSTTVRPTRAARSPAATPSDDRRITLLEHPGPAEPRHERHPQPRPRARPRRARRLPRRRRRLAAGEAGRAARVFDAAPGGRRWCTGGR